MKPSDLCAVLACSKCHDAIDGRVYWKGAGVAEEDIYVLEAMCRTLQIWTDEGLV